ncbi:hypothetical protein OAS78_11895, partial [Pseudomonadales bacterium]|nr:hypothetical protein [Pseudomonadales bacterium]
LDTPSISTIAGEQVNNLLRGNTYRYTYLVRFTKDATNLSFGVYQDYFWSEAWRRLFGNQLSKKY